VGKNALDLILAVFKGLAFVIFLPAIGFGVLLSYIVYSIGVLIAETWHIAKEIFKWD